MAEEGPGLAYERCLALQARIQTFAWVLTDTKGIRNHFWEEATCIGEEQNLTEEKMEWYLKQLTDIRNLDSAQWEWPYNEWGKIVQEFCKVGVLRSYLNEVCAYKYNRANNPPRLNSEDIALSKNSLGPIDR